MEEYPDPYPLGLVPKIVEAMLALVPCSLKIEGVDAQPTDPTVKFAETETIWDIGAHVSIIIEDMLPANTSNIPSINPTEPLPAAVAYTSRPQLVSPMMLSRFRGYFTLFLRL